MSATTTSTEKIEQAYLEAFERVMAALKAFEQRIYDTMPPPQNEDGDLNWADVGEMQRLASQVEGINNNE
jgi:hypothetical protein